MKKGKALAKQTMRIGKSNTSGRKVIDDARLRERLNPPLSKQALDKIDRLEAAGLRVQQRLGLIRLD